MPELFTLSFQEAKGLSLNRKCPNGFRYAKVSDFIKDGKRIDYLVLYLRMGEYQLQEFWFCESTSRNYIQWLLNNERLFIKNNQELEGKNEIINFILEPSEEFLKRELKLD